MRGRVAASLVFYRSCAAAGVIGVLAILAPEAAHSQGLFDVLRGIFGGGRPPPQRMAPPMPLDIFPGGDPRGPGGDIRVPADGSGPRATYCVRLCDGRYFPVSTAGGQSPQQLCSAMCPAAKTDVYSGAGIENAFSSGGKSYTSLANAFVYRDRLVNGCSCTADGGAGVAKIDIEEDPTLRPGDIVTTKDGQTVFKGDRRLPHKSSDFTPVPAQKQTSAVTKRRAPENRSLQEGRAVSVPAGPGDPAPNQALGFARENGSGVRRVGPLGD